MLDQFFKGWGKCESDGIATLDCLTTVFSNVINALLLFAGTTALIMFLMGGFKFMNAAGDPKKIESAKHSFTYGLLGLAVVFFSYFIIQIISQITGVGCIKVFGFECK